MQQGSDNIKSYYYNIQTSNFETFAERVLCESYVARGKGSFRPIAILTPLISMKYMRCWLTVEIFDMSQ